MDRYEKSAEWLIKRGDAIISERKRKAAIIRRISFSVSGLCAAIIVGVGIWHNSSINTPPDMNHFTENNIITNTTASSEITTQPKVTVSSSAKAVNVTTTQAINTSVVSKSTETKQPTQTTLNTTKPIITELTESARTETTTVTDTKATMPIITSETIYVTNTTSVATETHNTTTTSVTDNKATMPTITSETKYVTNTTSLTTDIKVTTTSSETDTKATMPIITSETTCVTNITSVTTELNAATTTSTNEVIDTTTTSVFDLKISSVTVVINEKNMQYQNQHTRIEENKIKKFICTTSVMSQTDELGYKNELIELFEIDEIAIEEAIAVKSNDTGEYFFFNNPNYKKEDGIT